MALVVSARRVFCAISFHSEIAAAAAAWFVSFAVAVDGAPTTSEVSSRAAVPVATDLRTTNWPGLAPFLGCFSMSLSI